MVLFRININRFAIADLQAAQEQKERATAEVNGPTRSGRARAREIEGIAALGKQDWAGAQRAFEQCEIEYPRYHACYEFSKILKEKKTDAEKADSLLHYESYLPRSTVDRLTGLLR